MLKDWREILISMECMQKELEFGIIIVAFIQTQQPAALCTDTMHYSLRLTLHNHIIGAHVFHFITITYYKVFCSMNPYNIKGAARATTSMYGTVGQL